MLGAHFDTWHASPNASDNSSGVAVMSSYENIKNNQCKTTSHDPRGSMVWKEQGLHGSREYVYKHFGDPNDPKIGKKKDYDKLSAYFNQDYGRGNLRVSFCRKTNTFVRYLSHG